MMTPHDTDVFNALGRIVDFAIRECMALSTDHDWRRVLGIADAANDQRQELLRRMDRGEPMPITGPLCR